MGARPRLARVQGAIGPPDPGHYDPPLNRNGNSKPQARPAATLEPARG